MTFNLFNVIFLITEGEPAESTNILVTALYNAAFGRNGTSMLGFAAAFSLLLFLMLLGMVVVWVRSTGALKGVYD
jgi:arabinogalactan oligomer/maltooligosaccharide transport system permease protein